REPRACRAARDPRSRTPRVHAPAERPPAARSRRPARRRVTGTRARSRAQTLPLGVEERTQANSRGLEPAVDADLERRVLARLRRGNPREPDRPPELRTPP